MKILLTLFLFISSSSIYAWIEEDSSMKLTDEIKRILEYSSIKEQYQSADKKSQVILYRSGKTLEEGEIADEILNFIIDDDSLWLYEGYGFNYFDITYLNNNNALFKECSNRACQSVIFNFQNKKITPLGGGSYEVIDDKYIRLNHSKSYDENGAYWVDKLVNFQGELVKIISGPKTEYWDCKPLNQILVGYDVSSLEQPLDECIYVFR